MGQPAGLRRSAAVGVGDHVVLLELRILAAIRADAQHELVAPRNRAQLGVGKAGLLDDLARSGCEQRLARLDLAADRKPVGRRLRRRPRPHQQDAIGGIEQKHAGGVADAHFERPPAASYPAPVALWKLSTKEPATRRQPSTSTKKISLNGRLTTTGGSIIMPMLMRTLATTRSMTRNGTNSRKPISKPRLSSEI